MRRHIINTYPRWHRNSKQLYSKYACLIDDYEYSIGNDVMQCKQTILYSKHAVFSLGAYLNIQHNYS